MMIQISTPKQLFIFKTIKVEYKCYTLLKMRSLPGGDQFSSGDGQTLPHLVIQWFDTTE